MQFLAHQIPESEIRRRKDAYFQQLERWFASYLESSGPKLRKAIMRACGNHSLQSLLDLGDEKFAQEPLVSDNIMRQVDQIIESLSGDLYSLWRRGDAGWREKFDRNLPSYLWNDR